MGLENLFQKIGNLLAPRQERVFESAPYETPLQTAQNRGVGIAKARALIAQAQADLEGITYEDPRARISRPVKGGPTITEFKGGDPAGRATFETSGKRHTYALPDSAARYSTRRFVPDYQVQHGQEGTGVYPVYGLPNGDTRSESVAAGLQAAIGDIEFAEDHAAELRSLQNILGISAVSDEQVAEKSAEYAHDLGITGLNGW